MFEYWVREQDNNIECQNWEVLSIVDNFSAHSDIGGLKAIELFSATEYYVYNPADGSKTYLKTKSQLPLPNDSTNYQSN